jgi:hypothetical protein
MLHRRVAVADRDAPDVELGRRQRQKQREQIVDAGIGVDDYGEWGGGSGT